MRIVGATRTPYYPLGRSGIAVIHRAVFAELARRGHDVCLLARGVMPAHAAEMQRRRVAGEAIESRDGLDVFKTDGVEVHAYVEDRQFEPAFERLVANVGPDAAILSCELLNRTHRPLSASPALAACGARAVSIYHGPANVPFGPISFTRNADSARLLRESTVPVIAVSGHLCGYLLRWGGVRSQVMQLPAFGPGPFPDHGARGSGHVTMTNPCAHKGISIFLELARRMPDVPFATIPSYATTAADLAALRALPNMTLLPYSTDLDQAYATTRLLLHPALLPEGFPLTTVEAMLRGIPVIASDAGGLPESKLGTDHVIPVRQVTRAADEDDEFGVPRLDIVDQDIQPWCEALRALVDDPAEYALQSRLARAAATRFHAGLGIEPLEQLLRGDREPA